MGVPEQTRSAIVDRLRAAGCVSADEEAELLLAEEKSPDELALMVARRVGGRPLEQVLGWAEFCGLRIALDPGVFIPRRRTELLAREAIEVARCHRRPVVVDLCCGSGAVGAALVAAVSDLELYATDIDPAAVACARGNLPGESRVLIGDLCDPLPSPLRGRIDVLVANTPYVPSAAIATLPQEARLHEPRAALDGGPDGLDVQRRVADGALGWLAPGGSLLMETSAGQAPDAAEILARAGLSPRVLSSEELDATAVAGSAPLLAER
ncbi:MAG: putative protein N(5)-glutamine methyltransferase [Thermoleophilaceae bacterium]|nr:putative protein N(5)-glutamine methyltransferase [Thermoleophilaceae bacterium]